MNGHLTHGSGVDVNAAFQKMLDSVQTLKVDSVHESIPAKGVHFIDAVWLCHDNKDHFKIYTSVYKQP